MGLEDLMTFALVIAQRAIVEVFMHYSFTLADLFGKKLQPQSSKLNICFCMLLAKSIHPPLVS